MKWACIACSAGWFVAFVSFALFFTILDAIQRHERLSETNRDTTFPARTLKALGLAMIFLVALGSGSCVIEDRVCEMAARGDSR